MIYIDILDNQKLKAFKKHFPEATIFKVEENSRTFQGFHPKFKDFSRLCKLLKEKNFHYLSSNRQIVPARNNPLGVSITSTLKHSANHLKTFYHQHLQVFLELRMVLF